MKDNYIKLLQWGRDNIDGCSASELQTKLKELELPFDYDHYNNNLNAFTIGIFVNYKGRYYLSFEGYFELNEHERLEEARKSSSVAKWIAICALIISIAVGLWQIMLMYYSSDAI